MGLAGSAGTVRAAFERVMQQVSTSNRMLPELLHVFFTNDCRMLEGDLHRSLKELGLWSYEGAGTEWFRADLETVCGLVRHS